MPGGSHNRHPFWRKLPSSLERDACGRVFGELLTFCARSRCAVSSAKKKKRGPHTLHHISMHRKTPQWPRGQLLSPTHISVGAGHAFFVKMCFSFDCFSSQNALQFASRHKFRKVGLFRPPLSGERGMRQSLWGAAHVLCTQPPSGLKRQEEKKGGLTQYTISLCTGELLNGHGGSC